MTGVEELAAFLKWITAADTPLMGVAVFLLWRMDRALLAFTTAVRTWLDNYGERIERLENWRYKERPKKSA